VAELDRKQVNDGIEHIVRSYGEQFLNCPSEVTVTTTIRRMIDDLKAHMDATVEAAYQWGVDDMARAARQVR
jgi:hypothetical protein